MIRWTTPANLAEGSASDEAQSARAESEADGEPEAGTEETK
jgi:hypothetical protein